MLVSGVTLTEASGLGRLERGLRRDPDASATVEDRISISEESKSQSTSPREEATEETPGSTERGTVRPKELTPEQQEQVRRLQIRDREVRAHEAAHAATAGQFGGGISFDYAVGPDGRQYAVGGEVPVRLESGRTPEETIRNAQRVRSAALAPMSPSAQDRSVAAAAAQMESDARLAQIRLSSEALAEKAQEAAKSRVEDARASGDATEVKKAIDNLRNEDAVLQSVVRERQQSGNIQSHAHSMQSCGFCGKAVASYQQF